MKVRELKEYLEKVSDDAEVVIAGNDHNFRVAAFGVCDALKDKRGHLFEFYGDEYPRDPTKDEKVVKVLLFD